MLTAKSARIEIAKKIICEYLPNDQIAAIAISGSTARGGVDNYSDLEIAFFWKEEPGLNERTEAINRLSGEITRQITPDIDLFFGVDNFNLKDLAVDIVHNLLPKFTRMIDDVISKVDIDLKRQALMAITSSFYPLYGEDEVQKLKENVSFYANDYQRKVFLETKLPNLGVLKLHASRKDFVPYYRHLSKGIISLLSVLCALNKVYFPGEKRVGYLIGQLKITPDSLHKRVEKIYQSDYAESILQLEELTQEIVHLIIKNTNVVKSDLDQNWKTSRRTQLTPDEILKTL